MNNLACSLAHRGQWPEAERMRREVLALRLEVLGGRHPDTFMAIKNLAYSLADRGQWRSLEGAIQTP
ncbi:hypothetical protein PIIN_11525 [Serendipita indica DSM 11827]|uniref:Kinesin light chain n=1 Tax=Serendipita indica (strain DSM 11827) TaxID=1109443 RepID=G4U1V5_SERID|nr:hypothetical protein PIIN_11525 [Serendipita indica DSM 11827]